jgi:dihydrofolate synthase / folylpolyglutamate synthase
MLNIGRQSPSKSGPQPKIRIYSEVVEYLDAHWLVNSESKTLERIKALDAAFDNPSQKVKAIIVAGTNGKSLAVHLTNKLLKSEGLKTGALYAPHLLTYNERFTINDEMISNKHFTDIGNDVINAAESLNIKAHTPELLTMMALLYFVKEKVDVALFEAHEGGTWNPVAICSPIITAITRVTASDAGSTEDAFPEQVADIMGLVKKNTWVVSSDQIKNNLQTMEQLTEKKGGRWAMPIRKLASLDYPFEQIHGRCAALAERCAQLFMTHLNKDANITSDTLLSKQKGKRGRPTSEEKERLSQNPHLSLDTFWKGQLSELPGRFQTFERENPTIILDNASNLDALRNVLLGIRLMQYKSPYKGLAIVMAASQNTMYNEEFLKLIRYFFKKISGNLFICPITSSLPGVREDESWDVEKVTNDIKSMRVRARACVDFEEAFELAKKSVDERRGLVVITGSSSIVSQYLRHKGIKMF